MKLSKLGLRVLAVLFPIIVHIICKRTARGVAIFLAAILIPMMIYIIPPIILGVTIDPDFTSVDAFSIIGFFAGFVIRIFFSVDAWELINKRYPKSTNADTQNS